MRIALELNETECNVLIDILNQKIRRMKAYRDSHEEYWGVGDEKLLEYKVKLRDKILEFSYLQETIDKED